MNFTPTPTKLKRQNWCGPFALAIMAGQDYDVVYPRALRSLRTWTNKRYGKGFAPTLIRGLHAYEFRVIAKTLGYKIEWERFPTNRKGTGEMTLRQALDHLLPKRFYVIELTRHYITIDTYTWQWCDNHVKTWRPISDCKWLRTRVGSVAQYQPKWRSK